MGPELSIRSLNLWYGENQALYDISLDVDEESVTALIGPSGCGKSWLLRCINRMNDGIKRMSNRGKYRIGWGQHPIKKDGPYIATEKGGDGVPEGEPLSLFDL